MRYSSIITSIFAIVGATAIPASAQYTSTLNQATEWNSNISIKLFAELEELSRIVDITYCVGTTGISKPFECVSRCHEFPEFELVDTFNTGPLMSDSCGYIVLDHGTGRLRVGRIIVAFRGTYSIASTIVDLETVPQEYIPYPDSPDNSSNHERPILSSNGRHDSIWNYLRDKSGLGKTHVTEEPTPHPIRCDNCTVHSGFWTSWQNTRSLVVPHLKSLKEKYPDYRVDLVGHSLGGAVAALAGLEFDALGWEPILTTFGEPRIGNKGLRNYIDGIFKLPNDRQGEKSDLSKSGSRYRRVTHVDDPVPLLPLQEWGYRSHAGEVYISKPSLQPTLSDIRICFGDEDIDCMAGAEVNESWFQDGIAADAADIYNANSGEGEFEVQEAEVDRLNKRWGIPIPARYKMWQLFFAHRDYFWRLGLCVPGGDPLDWGRDKYHFDDEEGREEL